MATLAYSKTVLQESALCCCKAQSQGMGVVLGRRDNAATLRARSCPAGQRSNQSTFLTGRRMPAKVRLDNGTGFLESMYSRQ
tara:strand:- start:2925 stop:3170 length:246 start_codon:yes stop_codon:yes gene_type:complete